ncbi:ABC transporter substrate-binding protein [Embleya sp. MST-111070]|uniref:ABC transporter substrate-binding protein n=1 Tax=Embleya sp. MST-111070 TaxID=3398231 RepID=UPI003F733723
MDIAREHPDPTRPGARAGAPVGRIVRTVVPAVAACLVLGACGGGDDAAGKDADTSTVAPKSGGTLTVAMASDMRSMDPFGALSNSYTDNSRLNAVYDSLFWHEAKTGKVMPQIGESLTPDPGNASWTLKLKPNVKFSDGTPYDAAAVKFTWDEHAAPARKSYQAGTIAAVKTTEAVDPTTLKITLTGPNANFDHIVASNLSFIVSPTAYRRDPAGFARNPVGAGPYTFKEWTTGDHMTFVKNRGYWQGAAKPYADTVVFKVIQDSTQGLETVYSGGADMKVSVNAEDPVKARQKGLETKIVTIIGGESIYFNNKRAPFDDVRARRAVQLALDADEVNKISFSGNGTPTHSIFPPESPLVDAGTETVQRTDRAEAQRLLDELAAEGKPLDFTYSIPQNANAQRTAEYIMTSLRALRNISVKIAPMPIAAFQTDIVINKNYQAAMFSYYLSDAEPGLYVNLYSTSPNNYLLYANPTVDQNLDRARTTNDPAQRKAAYTAVAAQLKQDAPLWTYQSSVVTAFHRSTVVGMVLSNDGMVLMDRIGLKG